jgi:hypothetical protein
LYITGKPGISQASVKAQATKPSWITSANHRALNYEGQTDSKNIELENLYESQVPSEQAV